MRLDKLRSRPTWLARPHDLHHPQFGGDPEQLAAARVAVAARPIDYPYGSGQAEEVALAAGLKPIIRQYLPLADVAAARARFEAQGYLTRVGDGRMNDKRFAGSVLHVGRDPRALDASLALDTEGDDNEAFLGQLLGYPECCVDAFLELRAPRRNLQLLALALQRSKGLAAPRLNIMDLGVFHYISWVPCALDCAASLRYADAVAEHVRQLHGRLADQQNATQGPRRRPCAPGCRHDRFVDAIDVALAAHRLVLFEDVQISLTGSWQAGELVLAEVWPTARDRHPGAVLEEPAAEATARLLALLRQAQRISVVDRTLFVDGRPTWASADMLLVAMAARR